MSSINNNPNAGAAPVPGQSQGAPNQVGNETGTGNPGAAPASGPAGGTLPADVGAALADAGVMAPTVETPDSLPTQKKDNADLKPRVEHHAKDEVDTSERPKDTRGTERKAEPNADDRGMVRNPFGELRRGAVEARAHELASALDVDTEIDVPLNAQGKLLGFGKKLMGKGAERAPQVVDRLADGMLLVGDDAQGVTLKQAAKKAAQSESRRFLNKTEHTRHMKRLAKIMQQMKLSRIGSDPQSFVMRVMREAYAIGNEQMKDYADRLKKTNELRKQIREEAARAREARTESSGLEAEDLLPIPFDMKDVNATAGQLDEVFYTQQDVDEAKRAAEQDAAQRKHSWEGPSAMDDSDQALWNRMKKGGDVHHRRLDDSWDEVHTLLSKATLEDYHSIVVPTLTAFGGDRSDNFAKGAGAGAATGLATGAIVGSVIPGGGTAVGAGVGAVVGAVTGTIAAGFDGGFVGTEDEDRMLDVIEALDPYLALLVLSENRLRGGGKDKSTIDGKSDQNRYLDIFTAKVEALDAQGLTDKSLTDELFSYRNFGSQEREYQVERIDDAAAHLLGIVNQGLEDGYVATPEVDSIEVGAKKQATTVGQLDDYLKYLEDELNSAGEDGQLMNIELQNQLQKQQQQLQMMSNMSKAMHDVAMGILRNVGS